MQAAVDKRKLAEKLKKEKLAALRMNRPTGHDGWFEALQIYLPKVSSLISIRKSAKKNGLKMGKNISQLSRVANFGIFLLS